jgi:hypothetical protein
MAVEQDKRWRRWSSELHDDHHRIFTQEEAQAMSDFIVSYSILSGHCFANDTFRDTAMKKVLITDQ